MKKLPFKRELHCDLLDLMCDWYIKSEGWNTKTEGGFPEKEIYALFIKAGIDDELPRNVWDEIGRHEFKMRKGRIKYTFHPMNKQKLIKSVVTCRKFWESMRVKYWDSVRERNDIVRQLNWWFFFSLALLIPYLALGIIIIGHFLGTIAYHLIGA
jgi:hypothetical protein